ncbi:MAG TPA: DUF2461 domain-containing protein [Candidatus Dormibacteraeota bacterium]|nr:DUF2461 domain-containing protein [Candidatus Dormibacteraeota bacterium]
MAESFKGWPEDFQRFFIGLQLDNSKKYFEAHRGLYEESVKAPMVALLESLEKDYGEGKVFRINRDIRFSKDKSPYKTNIAATVGMGHKGGYLSLDARGLTVATGRYEMSPEELAMYRKKAAADASGGQLDAIVKKLVKSGYELGGEELKRVPAPWPQDHPRADLLRRKSLYIWKNFGLQPWLGSAAARRQVVKVWTDAQPLNDWFNKNL